MRRLAPSPAMLVALIALFVSLGGVSYGVATGSITGKAVKNNTIGTKDLKNNDIRGSDIRNNSLTGADVNESKLGKVPRAGSADSASSAANAGQLGGQAPSAYQERAIAGFRDGPVGFGGNTSAYQTVVTLSLPAGSYAISAKLYVSGTNIAPPPVNISCRLLAGTDTDQTMTSLDPPGPDYGSIALQVAHTATTGFAAVVQCSSLTIGGGLVTSAQNAKITALPVDNLTNQTLSG